jgi:cyclase
MKARTIAIMLAAAIPTAFSQTTPKFPVVKGKTYTFEKVGDGVYYATGGVGSNNVMIVNDQDVMLVDDGTTPATARAFLEDVKTITNKPVRYVVNTHFHYDHTDGNSVFPPDVQIIAHDYVRTAILTFDVLHREPYKTGAANAPPAVAEQLREVKAVPPNTTYASKMVLHKGQREIQLLFLGRGHTGGDTVVFLPKERIVCTGDLMESRIAYMGDAFFDEWITTLDALKKLDFALDLPGHGVPFRDKALITAFQSYLTDITKQAGDLRKKGVAADDAAKRVDLTSHQKDFPQIQGPGAEVRGVRRIYQWMDERGVR